MIEEIDDRACEFFDNLPVVEGTLYLDRISYEELCRELRDKYSISSRIVEIKEYNSPYADLHIERVDSDKKVLKFKV